MSLRGERITARTPAKINLFLEVRDRRPDGLHNLRSLLVPVSVEDVLEFETTDGLIVTEVCLGDLPQESVTLPAAPEQNLATRAAVLLKEVTGYAGGARIRIVKNIPIGGGLGGGSADAAATLNALNVLWGTGLDEGARMALGAKLGCDVPALVHGGPVLMEGAGERVGPVAPGGVQADGAWWVVVVNPGWEVSTGDIYSRYKSSLTCAPEVFNTLQLAWQEGAVERAAANLFNSLQPTVFIKYPLLAIIAEELRRAGALGVLLSGSGASIFALARDGEHAGVVQRRVGQAMGDWLWCRVARILPDGVMVAHSPLEARV